MTPFRRRSVKVAALVLLLAVFGCAEEREKGGSGLGLPTRRPPAAGKGAGKAGAGPHGGARTYRDSDFVESDRNRDPFRSYADELRIAAPVVAQRAVLMPNTPIDAMRLIAIVSGIAKPRAMLVDEKGVGYVAARGDFVGKADVLAGGGTESLPVTINWRVDRIRENEVVLSREDPSSPSRPKLTRVIPLRDESDLMTGASDEG